MLCIVNILWSRRCTAQLQARRRIAAVVATKSTSRAVAVHASGKACSAN
jgi:hypothetical protein